MPTQYIIPVVGGNEKDSNLVKVLTNIITELEKLQEAEMQVAKTTRIQEWNKTFQGQQKKPKKQFSFGDYVQWFPKDNKSQLGKFTMKWFEPYIIQYVLLNIIVFLVTIEKFETNRMLVRE